MYADNNTVESVDDVDYNVIVRSILIISKMLTPMLSMTRPEVMTKTVMKRVTPFLEDTIRVRKSPSIIVDFHCEVI